MLNLTSNEILVGWKVVVHLRALESGSNRTKRKIDAKVEEDQNPISFNLYIRRYGQTHREKFRFIDQNNTLNPPVTNNKTYQYRFAALEPMNAYEFCLQSVNSGQITETDEISRQFPVNAMTELAGRNNPLFICKEIILPPPPSPTYISEPDIERRNNENRFTGRSGDSSIIRQNNNGAAIQVSEEFADRFVVYTAITTGTTTVFVLVIMFIFCCCHCRRSNDNKNGQQNSFLYDRVGHNMIPSPYYEYRN
ncbi:hypothetical protein BLA29_004662 [Euroglyphus maynei]|uniref:Uncharacterized protein n=1 Tax=Euroglyphus maynei TaxID=6958 RepID=A0A1Y3BV41_EURMA|nr:hypothetical protein BLA29_004662 [Euroglyphus maynei]